MEFLIKALYAFSALTTPLSLYGIEKTSRKTKWDYKAINNKIIHS